MAPNRIVCFAGALVVVLIAVVCLPITLQSEDRDSCNPSPIDCTYARMKCSVLNRKDEAKKVTESSIELLHVFCYPGQEKMPIRLWMSPMFYLSIPNKEFSLYFGKNFTEVDEKYSQSYFSVTSWWKKEELSLYPFNASCVGIATKEAYSVILKIKNPDIWFVAYLFAGVVLFTSARSWSRNTALHYGTGVGIGLLASLLIVVFIFSRLIPTRAGAYTLLAGGWAVVLYLLNWLWLNVQVVLELYWQALAGYLVVVGVASFALVYKVGPVTNDRSLDLIRWSLQLVALMLMYCGTQIPEISFALIIIILGIHNFPQRIIYFNKRVWYRLFPPTVKLLTEQEYIHEGDKETRKAMEDLRAFCRSPECNSWKTVSVLKSPTRFASFVSGDSHITDQELMLYDGGSFDEDEDEDIPVRPLRFASFVSGDSHITDQELMLYDGGSFDEDEYGDIPVRPLR